MYCVDPAPLSGRDSFTCNGSHVLVLEFNGQPSSVQRRTEATVALPFFYTALVVDGGLMVERSFSYATQAEADRARAAAVAAWRPSQWECTVDQFLRCAPAVQAHATMITATDTLFTPPLQPLRSRLQKVLRRDVSEQDVDDAAWLIGVWLTGRTEKYSGMHRRDDLFHAGRAHGILVDRGIHIYRRVFGEDRVELDASTVDTDQDTDDERSEAAAAVCVSPSSPPASASSTSSVASPVSRSSSLSHSSSSSTKQLQLPHSLWRLLKELGLIGEKQHIPSELLREERRVRLALLAGIIVGGGRYTGISYEVSGEQHRFIDDVIHLARGLGLVVCQVAERSCTSEEPSASASNSFSIRIGGLDLQQLPVELPHERHAYAAPQQQQQQRSALVNPRCAGFTISRIAHADYYGLELDGNHRCLLSDFVVTHNSGALHGKRQDSTPFQFSEQHRAVDYFGEELVAAGYNYVGTEPMYSGITGEECRADIFIGVVYYQRLRHMVSDKAQVRATGPVNRITRQPIKGRKVHGGIRFGEMERDSLLGHGTAFLLHDRLMMCSDYHTTTVCTLCGSLLSPMPTRSGGATSDSSALVGSTGGGRSRLEVTCRACKTGDGCATIAIPYVFMYLANELAAMGVKLTLSVK